LQAARGADLAVDAAELLLNYSPSWFVALFQFTPEASPRAHTQDGLLCSSGSKHNMQQFILHNTLLSSLEHGRNQPQTRAPYAGMLLPC
jgi:hypothetical protein